MKLTVLFGSNEFLSLIQNVNLYTFERVFTHYDLAPGVENLKFKVFFRRVMVLSLFNLTRICIVCIINSVICKIHWNWNAQHGTWRLTTHPNECRQQTPSLTISEGNTVSNVLFDKKWCVVWLLWRLSITNNWNWVVIFWIIYAVASWILNKDTISPVFITNLPSNAINSKKIYLPQKS